MRAAINEGRVGIQSVPVMKHRQLLRIKTTICMEEDLKSLWKQGEGSPLLIESSNRINAMQK